MTRLLLVVNDGSAPSETFLRSLVIGLTDRGIEVLMLEGASKRRRRQQGIYRALPRSRCPEFAVALVAWIALDFRRALGLFRRAVSLRIPPLARARAFLLALPVSQLSPDVVMFGFSGIAVSYRDASLLIHVPTIVSCRGSAELVLPRLDPARISLLGAVLRDATIVHCVSSAMEQVVRGFGAERTRVVRPAVDPARFAPGPAPPMPPCQLLSVGRLEWIKGLDDAIRAVAILVREGCDVEYSIVGAGSDRDRLLWLAQELEVADRVSFLGARSPEEVKERLRQSHVFVQPSLSEGISNAVLEAMSMALPVVSTRVGGMEEVITSGRNGILVEPLNPSGLADALRSLVTAPVEARTLGMCAREMIMNELDTRTQIDAYAEMIREALQA